MRNTSQYMLQNALCLYIQREKLLRGEHRISRFPYLLHSFTSALLNYFELFS
jgi:hypothetical protein